MKDQQLSAVADSEGQWKVKLGPLSEGGPFTLTIAGKNTIVLHDVLVGEVWVCSGQSNMEMPVSTNPEGWSGGVTNYQEEIARADYPELRLFTVHKAGGQASTRRKRLLSQARPPVSAEACCRIFLRTGITQGTECPDWDDSQLLGWNPAESWTVVARSIRNRPKSILNRNEVALNVSQQCILSSNFHWRQESDKAESDGAPVPTAPKIPDDPGQSLASCRPLQRQDHAAHLRNPGAIWYQGESNADSQPNTASCFRQ